MTTWGENEQKTYVTLFCHSSQSLFSTNECFFNQEEKMRNSMKCTEQSIINRCMCLCASNWRVKNTGRKKTVYADPIVEFTVCCIYARSSRERSLSLRLFTLVQWDSAAGERSVGFQIPMIMHVMPSLTFLVEWHRSIHITLQHLNHSVGSAEIATNRE